MKVFVAHPVQQHSYRLASALKQGGMLEKYATTVYNKEHSLTRLVAALLQGNFKEKANGRRCEELDDTDVIQFCEAGGLLKLLALNTPFFKNRYEKIKYKTADRFAVKAAEYALKCGADAVVTYDNTSPLLFEILKEKAPQTIRILDTSAANPFYMESIYERDFLLAPTFETILRNERKLVWDEETRSRSKREIALAQHFLVPSDFVARSLQYSGVEENQLHTCPYGVDVDAFSQKVYSDVSDDRPLECIYVGGVKELKGIYYLLEAFRRIPPQTARLTVVGKADLQWKELQPYLDKVRFTGTVLHSQIPSLLQSADVFVFPSLGEGLSLSVLEAAACGLPLIVSENAGVQEKMTDGREGFIIPIQSVDAIYEKVMWFSQNRDRIAEMGNHAAQFARKYTWSDYTDKIINTFRNL